MTSQNKLLPFVKDALVAWEGIIDEKEDALDCLLPAALAEQLVLDEEVTIALPAAEKGEPLIYGEALLDNLLDLVQEKGRCSFVELQSVRESSANVRNAFQRRIRIREATSELLNVKDSTGHYLLLHYRCIASCKDRRRTFTGQIAINEETHTNTPWLFDHLPLHAPKESSTPTKSTPLEELLPLLKNKIAPLVTEQIGPFQQQIEQQISRTRRRHERQHRRERKQLLKPLLKDSSLDQTETLAALKEAEEAYINAVQPLADEFPIHVSIEPYAALRLSMPIQRAEFHVKSRKEARVIQAIWNPLLDDVEPLLCESSGKETHHLYAMPDLTLLCLESYTEANPS